MAQIVIGPLLRFVSRDSATIWIETDRPCEVRVLDTVTSTFPVWSHHYALVVLRGLDPESCIPYVVADVRSGWAARYSAGTRQSATGRGDAGFAWLGEKLRRGLNMEDWAAFDRSFRPMEDLIAEIATGPRRVAAPKRRAPDERRASARLLTDPQHPCETRSGLLSSPPSV